MSPQKSDMAMPCRLPLTTVLCGGGGAWHPASGTVPSLHLPPVQAASIPPHGGGLRDRPSLSAMCRRRVRTEKLMCQAHRLWQGGRGAGGAGCGGRAWVEEGRLRKRLGQSARPQ